MIHNWLLYIDPGSGSYLVQVLIAAVLGVGFFFKNLRTYVKAFFSRSEKTHNDNHPPA